jgi:hypothetical protein
MHGLFSWKKRHNNPPDWQHWLTYDPVAYTV